MIRTSTLSASRRDLIALLGACCMFLSLVEYMIPKPVPFLRLGLANLPVLVALGLLSGPQVLLVVTIKVIGQGLLNGTLFSYVFVLSVAGSFASALCMLAVSRLGARLISFIGISVIGSMASTVTQLVLASLLVFGRSGMLIAPPFLAAGLVTSVALGIIAAAFCGTSKWYRVVREEVQHE